MSNTDQSTEVFRFVCARPAQKDHRSIKIIRRRILIDSNDSNRLRAGSTSASPFSVAVPSAPFELTSLNYYNEITALNKLLALDSATSKSKARIGRNVELDAELVTRSVAEAFVGKDLADLVEVKEWKDDEKDLDRDLIRIYDDASDTEAVGPQITRYRQLYDLVRQVAAPLTGEEPGRRVRDGDGQEVEPEETPEPQYGLHGLELGSLSLTLSDSETRQEREDPAAITRPQRMLMKKLSPEEAAKDKKIQDLLEALHFLNSSTLLEFRVIDTKSPFKFLLPKDWLQLLPVGGPREEVQNTPIGSQDASMSLRFCYDTIITAIRVAVAAKVAPLGKSGLFSIGPFNLEMTKPWEFPTGEPSTGVDERYTPEPDKPTASKIKPTGVGDLMVVRDHTYKYIGGDIGAIQNVLASEEMIHMTKRLERTELVEYQSTETTTEEEREQSTATRFALNKEANDVIKRDTAMKVGVSTTAYGPYVSVKGDISYAENNSAESSNKVASQYSQDITSRATSKIIEKAFKSTSLTTISEFQEAHEHSFKNGGPGAKNISGVYQWVNKVSQCTTMSADAGPSLEQPLPLTESAADLHEGNYASIAARYQATGITAPGDLLISFSKSFKAEVPPGAEAKPGGSSSRFVGSTGSVNIDLEIPAGYLAYAARIQVGVRTGPEIAVWHVAEEQGLKEWFPDMRPAKTPNPYISVAGRLVAAGGVKASEVTDATLDPVEKTALEATLTQNSVGVVNFTDHFVSTKIAVAVSYEYCLALSGTIQIFCVREPLAYAQWQNTTYDAIMTAYNKLKMDYERARTETAISSMTVTSGNNPLENVSIISTELKKAAIAFITSQNYKLFGTIVADADDGIPQVESWDKAIAQGKYAEFFEKAFEWENMTYELYPYFWGARGGWRERMGFHSPDPALSAFVKAGMAKVTVPARLGFGVEVLHLLQCGKTWKEGPVSTLATSPYYSVAQEIMAAEDDPQEVKVSAPWYTRG
ncbi:hypothetical protein B0J11DRAFT_599048 [Dendryphion nanum]|uniref:MACPF domain-containing protein n=1 Tax=Dendryphion nanum TaxID=256645 RepID=A0A9P9D1Y3_9PLEO|nr:hypothetical protein B0J11DRAFT_599048 [Dendryphion nanum]